MCSVEVEGERSTGNYFNSYANIAQEPPFPQEPATAVGVKPAIDVHGGDADCRRAALGHHAGCRRAALDGLGFATLEDAANKGFVLDGTADFNM